MKIAILIPGQPRFTNDFISFVSNLKGYQQADWFVYITNNNVPSITNNVEYNRVYNSWMKFDNAWAYEKIKSWLPSNNFIQRFEISDSDQQIFPPVKNLYCVGNSDNTWKMFYNLYKADCLRQQFEEENNFKYDLVIRSRSDLGIYKELDLQQLDIQENCIIMPENGWHGMPAANDQFAIGSSDNMKVYGTVYTRIKEFNDSGFHFHPESIVGHNLRIHGISTVARNFYADIRTMPYIDDVGSGTIP
jgi:hypothetical protein